MLDGLVVVDKPPGMTSHDAVGRCRRIFAQRRVGHAGTLDPDATGVLVVALGRATRLMRFMAGLGKCYTTEIVLGEATSTLDASGDPTATWDMSGVTFDQAEAAAKALTGQILQVPPMVSALKVGGRRLYELAREGVEVERAARPVTIDRFDVTLTSRGPHGPVLQAHVCCSTGTYIRVLADDLGQLLGGGAHVRNLRRTSVGPWGLDVAVPLEEVDSDALLEMPDVLPWLEAVHVDAEVERKVRSGRRVSLDDLAVTGAGPWRLLGEGGSLLAVYLPGDAEDAVAGVVIEAAG